MKTPSSIYLPIHWQESFDGSRSASLSWRLIKSTCQELIYSLASLSVSSSSLGADVAEIGRHAGSGWWYAEIN